MKGSVIAVVGGGRWGHVTLSELIKVESDFEHVVSVSGHNSESIDELIAKLQPNTKKKLSRCNSIDELLKKYNVTAAIIVNSPYKHYETAKLLLNNLESAF